MNRLLILTPEITLFGGVQASAKSFLEWVKTKPQLSPGLAWPALGPRRPENVSFRSLACGKFQPSTSESTFSGIPASTVGDFFPKAEFLRFKYNQSAWKKIFAKYDSYFAVTGYALDALPFALNHIPFCAWVATDLDSDREAWIQGKPTWIRTANRLQMAELRRLERLVLQQAKRVFALTPWMVERLVERGARADRTTVLAVPVDTNFWTRSDPNPAPPPSVVWSARLSDPRKNTKLLLQAFARILQQLPEAQLHLSGSQPDPSLQELAKKFSGNVIFHGDLSPQERLNLYRRSSVFAVPSKQEGLCISAVEAMATGLPVVSTRCGGPETYIRNGENGFLVSSEEEFANCLLQVLAENATRQRMSQRATAIAKAKFSIERFFQTLDSNLGEHLNLGRPDVRIRGV